MRIEFVTDTYPPDINGVAMTLGQLVIHLRVLGHNVHVTHTGMNADENETAARSFSFPGYKEVRVGLPRKVQFRKRWNENKPDAIYVATEAFLGVSAMKVAREMKIPIIAGFHTNFQQYFKQYFLSKAEQPTLSFLRKVHNACACTMVPSAFMGKELGKLGFENIRIMGRGVDTGLFHPSKRRSQLRECWKVSDDDCVVLIVGRVAKEKNVRLAIDISLDVRNREVQTEKMRLIVVGDGPLKSSLEKQYRDDGVIFAGMQTGNALAEHYASADVMFFASETETYGNVVPEALASGLITIGYDYAAAQEHVKNGLNGFLAPLGEEKLLAEALVKGVKNYANVAMRKSAAATETILCWNEVADIFQNNLTEVISEQPVSDRRLRSITPMRVRSIFVSDIHIGNEDCRAKEAMDLLRYISSDYLFLNGDIIDGSRLKNGSELRRDHLDFVKMILQKAADGDSEVIYLRGNQDDLMSPHLPADEKEIHFVDEYIHHASNDKKYLVMHGEGFDSVSTRHRILAKLGAFGYGFLLMVNRLHNQYRAFIGKRPYSFTKRIKNKVTGIGRFVELYEIEICRYAKKRGVDGVISGHLPQSVEKHIEGVHYLNSGEWSQEQCCILEHFDGRIERIYFYELLEKMDNFKSVVHSGDGISEQIVEAN